MSLGVDTNLKEMVVSSTLFGPREVQQIRDAIAADFANYRQLRDAVHELESAQSTSPAAATQAGCVLLPAGALPPGRRHAQQCRRRRDWPSSTWARPTLPADNTTKR